MYIEVRVYEQSERVSICESGAVSINLSTSLTEGESARINGNMYVFSLYR